MKKDMGLSDVKYFDPKRVLKIAQQHVTKMWDRVFQRGKDKDGNQFKDYSESYKDLIKRDFKTKSGKNYARYRGVSVTSSDKISKRYPRVTGITAKEFRQQGNKGVKGHGKDYYELGFDSKDGASRAKWLMDKGRDFMSGIPDKEFQWVVEQFGRAVEIEWNKIKNTTITVGK